ncbi:unnamed protein product [Hymenolepis diminuta]|uniref:RNA binding motif single stranded interacting n=1 Tax=Hymenolepis diminuta TaxID=6216 RepID=A0A0R3SBF5_HYMDI|nr:unnamed protein product [Hymenolepis diminuta]
MSYPNQWSSNTMIPPGTNLSAQGETLQNTAIFNPFQPNTSLRQPPLQMQLNQGQNPTGFCPPGAFSFLYPPFMAAALAAQSNTATVQTGQGPRFCVPQPSPGAGAAAAALRGPALLSAPTGIQGTAPPQQTQVAPGALPYFPGLHLAPAFPGAPTAPSFPPHGTSLSQQHGGGFLSPPFRAYDSLKHFGALPQATSHKKNKSMTTSKTNLYITGLSESDTDETVRALVEDIVHPKSCKAMLLNGKCKGSGFIDCVTAEDAVKALNHLTEISRNGGRQLVVKYALENEKDSYNIYVRNLPKTNFSKDALMSLFTPYGQVTSVKLLETEGVYTGIGFVRFASAEQARHAVESVNEKRYILCEPDAANGNGALKPVTCKLADKADPKRRAAAAAAAAASAMSGGNIPPTATSPSAGRQSKFHNPRPHCGHSGQPQQQQILSQASQGAFDMHLQGQQAAAAAVAVAQNQQAQNMANALAALNPNHQIPPGLIYQPAAVAAGGYLPPAPTANGPAGTIPNLLQSPPRMATAPNDAGSNPAASGATPCTTTSSNSTGLLEIPSQASPSGDQSQQQLLQQQQQQVAAVNGHSPSPAVDSRYAHMAAAFAAANNAMIYPPSNHQFPRVSSQQPLVQPTYSIANPHQAQQNPYAQPPNAVDLTAEQLQSLSLGGVSRQPPAGQPGGQQSTAFYPADWQAAAMAAAAGFQTGLPTTGSYQPVTSGSDVAYMDQTLALLNSYVAPQILQTQQPPVQSTHSPSQTTHLVNEGVGNLEVEKEPPRKSENESTAKEELKKTAGGKIGENGGKGSAEDEKQLQQSSASS